MFRKLLVGIAIIVLSLVLSGVVFAADQQSSKVNMTPEYSPAFAFLMALQAAWPDQYIVLTDYVMYQSCWKKTPYEETASQLQSIIAKPKFKKLVVLYKENVKCIKQQSSCDLKYSPLKLMSLCKDPEWISQVKDFQAAAAHHGKKG